MASRSYNDHEHARKRVDVSDIHESNTSIRRTLNTPISRGSFIKGAGAVVGGVAVTGLGFAKGASAQATNTLPMTSNPDPQNILSNGAGGWIVYPSGKNWLATGTNETTKARTIHDPNLSEEILNEIDWLLQKGAVLGAINTVLPEDIWDYWAHTKIISVDVAKKLITLEQDKVIKKNDSYSIGYIMDVGVTAFSYPNTDSGSFNTDSRNVYWALKNVDDSLAPNGMPTVLLKATKKGTSAFTPFVFPEGGRTATWSVPIIKNVILTGEVLNGRTFSGYQKEDLDGTPLTTTIEKGAAVFGVNFGEYPFANATNVEIKNLVSNGAIVNFIKTFYFDEDGTYAKNYPVQTNIHDIKIVELSDPIWSVIYGGIDITTVGSANVSNCLVRVAATDSLSWGIGIGIDRKNVIQRGTFTNNDIQVGSTVWGSWGFFAQTLNAGSNVLFQNNKVEADIAVCLSHSAANTQILNNTLTGIVFGIMADDPYLDNPNNSSAKVIIKGNTINMDTLNPDGSRKNPMVGPLFFWDSTSPIVSFAPYTAGVTGITSNCFPWDSSSLTNADISNNRFTGIANYVVYMGPQPVFGTPNTGSGNSFWGNNISGINLVPWVNYDGETVQPYSYYFEATTSGNTVAGQTGGAAYVNAGNSSNIITGPGLPKSCGIGTLKNPPINRISLTPEQQAAIDKMKSYLL